MKQRIASMILAAFVAAFLVLERPAHAAEESSPSTTSLTPEPPRPLVWYGWQILIPDAAIAGTLVLAEKLPPSGWDTTLSLLAVAGYLVDGPLVHLRHHQGVRAGVSVAMRLVLPIAGGIIGAAVGSSAARSKSDDGFASWFLPVSDALLGIGIGMGTASVVDVSALAWAHGHAPRVADSVPPAWSLSPSVGIVRDADGKRALTFGLSGSL